LFAVCGPILPGIGYGGIHLGALNRLVIGVTPPLLIFHALAHMNVARSAARTATRRRPHVSQTSVGDGRGLRLKYATELADSK